MVDQVLALALSKQGLIFLFIIIMMVSLYLHQKKTRSRINQWQKSLNLPQHLHTFQQLYQEIDGFKISRQARQTQDAIEYTYGEIEFLPFIALLSLTKLDSETVFYDLGSGIGKAVIACAMVYPVRKSVGIELFHELYLKACQQADHLAALPEYTEKAKNIKFIQGNFLEANLSEATLIFINSTALFGKTWENLCSQLNKLPQLKTIITTSKALQNDNFSLVNTVKIEMSWGVVLAFIYARKTNFN